METSKAKQYNYKVQRTLKILSFTIKKKMFFFSSLFFHLDIKVSFSLPSNFNEKNPRFYREFFESFP